MSGKRKRAALWVAAVGILFVSSGTATAVLQEKIFDVSPTQLANLAGTRVYCENGFDRVAKVRAFLCTKARPDGVPAKGTYAVAFSRKGAEISRIVAANGNGQFVRWFRSLPLQTSTAPDALFKVKDNEIAQLAGTPLGCGSQLTKGVRTFGCVIGSPATGAVRPRTYGALINERGVAVLRVDPNGKTITRVGQWSNP